MIVLGEAIRAQVDVAPCTIEHAHRRCFEEVNPAATDAVIQIAKASGVGQHEIDGWTNTLSTTPATDPDLVAARSAALKRCLLVRLGGVGVDAAAAMVDRLVAARAADVSHVELVADGCYHTATDVHSLLTRCAASDIAPPPRVVTRLAELILIEDDPGDTHRMLGQGTPALALSTRAAIDAQRRSLTVRQLEKLRLKTLRAVFSAGERGVAVGTSLVDKWSQRSGVLTAGLARYIIMQQHFTTRDHERVLQHMVAGGLVPDTGVYAALITRHRLEGDESAARVVVGHMTTAGVDTTGEALLDVFRISEPRLMKQRLALMARKAAQGAAGLADGLAAVGAMVERGRVDDIVIGLAIKHAIFSGRLDIANALYDRAVSASLFTHFELPRRGDTVLRFRSATPELATLAFARYLQWVREQVVAGPSNAPCVGAWCYIGLLLKTRANVSAADDHGQDIHTSIAIDAYLGRVGLRSTRSRDMATISIKGADIVTWARACSSATIAAAVLPAEYGAS